MASSAKALWCVGQRWPVTGGEVGGSGMDTWGQSRVPGSVARDNVGMKVAKRAHWGAAEPGFTPLASPVPRLGLGRTRSYGSWEPGSAGTPCCLLPCPPSAYPGSRCSCRVSPSEPWGRRQWRREFKLHSLGPVASLSETGRPQSRLFLGSPRPYSPASQGAPPPRAVSQVPAGSADWPSLRSEPGAAWPQLLSQALCLRATSLHKLPDTAGRSL